MRSSRLHMHTQHTQFDCNLILCNKSAFCAIVIDSNGEIVRDRLWVCIILFSRCMHDTHTESRGFVSGNNNQQ